MMDEDYQSRLRDMVIDRLDEAVSSAHFLHSNEPMVPILRQMCANFLWLVNGQDKSNSSILDSVSALRRLLREKPRRECDTDRLISLVADALLIYLTAILAGCSPTLGSTVGGLNKPTASATVASTPTVSTRSASKKVTTPATPASLPPTPPAPSITSTPVSSNSASKKARLEAKINGLTQNKKSIDAVVASLRQSPPLPSIPLFESPLASLIKKEPIEVTCRVGNGEDSNDDSLNALMDACSSDGNPLLRLLKEQEKRNGGASPEIDETGIEEEAAEGSGEEEYDFSNLLLNSSSNSFIGGMSDFADPFLNEPPIFSPSVSTIRKNTRRSKPEKIAEKGCTRVNRDPNAPRQVISAYLCFVGEMRMRRNNGDLHCNGGEFGQLLKSEWVKLPDKTRYEMQHEEDKRRYEAELAAWARSEHRPVPGRKAYSFYVLENYERVRGENVHLPDEDVITKVFVTWRDMVDKSKYYQLQQRDKERFRNEMKMYTARLAQNGMNTGTSPGQVTMSAKNGKYAGLLRDDDDDLLKSDIQMHLQNALGLDIHSLT